MMAAAYPSPGAMALASVIGLSTPVVAQDVATLESNGYELLTCTFRDRCVIGQPCAEYYRQHRYYVNDAKGRAYREGTDGRMRQGTLMQDARWGDLSRARAIIMPLREAVASQMTMFHDGGAILSVQYSADPGSGQFLRGRCVYGAPERRVPEAAEPSPPALTLRPAAPEEN